MLNLLLCVVLAPAQATDDPVLAWAQEIEFEVQRPAVWQATIGLLDGGAAVLVDVYDEALDQTRPNLTRLSSDGTEIWRVDAAPITPRDNAFGSGLLELPGGSRLLALGTGLDAQGQTVVTLTAIESGSGATVWTTALEEQSAFELAVHDLALAPDGSAVYVLNSAPYASLGMGSADQFRVTSFDPSTGAQIWSSPFGATDLTDARPVGLVVQPGSGRVVVYGASVDGPGGVDPGKTRPFAAGLDGSGSVAWQYSGAPAPNAALSTFDKGLSSDSGSAGFLSRGNSTLTAFDFDQGQLLWSVTPEHTLDFIELDAGGPIVGGVTFGGAVVTAYTGLGPSAPPRWTRTFPGLPFGPAVATEFDSGVGPALAIAFATAAPFQGGDAAYFELRSADGSVLEIAEIEGPQPGALPLAMVRSEARALLTFAPQSQLPSPPSVLARSFGAAGNGWIAPIRFPLVGRGGVAELRIDLSGELGTAFEQSLEVGGALDPCCRVRFFDARTGATLSEYSIDRVINGLEDRPVFAAAPDGSFAVALIDPDSARLLRIDASTGEVAWELDITDLGIPEADLVTINPDSSRVVLTQSTDTYPIPSGGLAYAHRVLNLDAATGVVLWDRVHSLDLIGSRLDAIDMEHHPVTGDVLLLSRAQTPGLQPSIELVALAEADGAEVWTVLHPAPEEIDAPTDLVLLNEGDLLAVPATRTRLVGGAQVNSALVVFLDGATGAVLEERELSAQFFSGPTSAIAGAGSLRDDQVILLSSEGAGVGSLGVLQGVRFGATEIQWSLPLGSVAQEGAAHFDTAAGRFAVTGGLQSSGLLSFSEGQDLGLFELEPLPPSIALPELPSSIVAGGPGALVAWQTFTPDGPQGELRGYGLPPLLTGAEAVSLAAGGIVELSLDFPPAPAVPPRFALILGTAGATSPGILIDQVTLPLTLDGYLLKSLNELNSGIFQGTFQQLDPDGNLQAQLVVPPGLSPSLAGLTLHHAALAFTLGGPADLVSNATPVQLVP